MKPSILLVLSLAGVGACTEKTVTPTQAPSPTEAQRAIGEMFGPSMANVLQSGSVVLGTCMATPAKYQPDPGQFSCSFLLKSPGGSSESQADFVMTETGWQAQPSVAQEALPFPDPKLHGK
ncbi:hypothetical protein [Chitinimonas taiwanensis]|uniref:hypothetical protein n=1 Tax=Chitinimonas taiwanensis TaxID=240412 RepID=UPI0035B276F1